MHCWKELKSACCWILELRFPRRRIITLLQSGDVHGYAISIINPGTKAQRSRKYQRNICSIKHRAKRYKKGFLFFLKKKGNSFILMSLCIWWTNVCYILLWIRWREHIMQSENTDSKYKKNNFLFFLWISGHFQDTWRDIDKQKVLRSQTFIRIYLSYLEYL